MTTTALARARAGDGEAFRELTDPHRRELQLHCYRILGSVQDAEDTLQETLLAAWRGLGRFEERASMRTWLYKIATNRCLNALRDTGRRPAAAARYQWSAPPPEPTRRAEPLWLQPYPDALLDDLPDNAPGPEARYETREAVALGVRGRAAAPAAPAARRPGAARRARLPRGAGRRHARSQRGVGEQRPAAGPRHARRPASSRRPRRRARAAVGPGARAHQPVRGRVRGRRHRPPGGPAHRGRVADHAARAAGIPGPRRDRRVLPDPDLVGGPGAPGWCPPAPTTSPRSATTCADPHAPVAHAHGLVVLTLAGDKICAITRFGDNSLFPHFGLPQTLPRLTGYAQRLTAVSRSTRDSFSGLRTT